MKSEEKCALLAEKIREIFERGFLLGSEAVRYIDSVFLNPSLQELEAVIRNESDCERDSLVELLFFPDESVQAELEDLLEAGDFQKADEKTVLNLLTSQEIETKLIFPGSRGGFKLTVPESVPEQFVSRLNISKNLDNRLIEAVNSHTPQKYRTRFRVKLRNARFSYTEEKVLFLAAFFEKTDMKSTDAAACLDFILGVLDEIGEDQDIFQALMDRKRCYFQNIQQAAKFEEQLKKNNMEILMLQGTRIPHIDKADVFNKIAMIDTICLTVFGRTDPVYGESPVIGEYRQTEDIKTLITIRS
jgi:hypothetical protein